MGMNVVLYYYLLIGVYFFALFFGKERIKPRAAGQAFSESLSH